MLVALRDIEIFDSINKAGFTCVEISIIKDYCSLTELRSITQFAYIIIYNMYNNSDMILREGGFETNTPIEFDNFCLNVKASSFIDDILILIETVDCRKGYVEFDVMYKSLLRFYDNIVNKLFLRTSDEICGFSLSSVEEALICRIT